MAPSEANNLRVLWLPDKRWPEPVHTIVCARECVHECVLLIVSMHVNMCTHECVQVSVGTYVNVRECM